MKRATDAQRRYLHAVNKGEITTSWGYVNNAPPGITMSTHNICERNGWVVVARGAYGDRKAVEITDTGRRALDA
jgi:hypothetical protein